MLKLRETVVNEKHRPKDHKGRYICKAFNHAHLKSLRFEEISRDGDKVHVMVVANNTFKIPLPEYCADAVTPISIQKNELIGAEYTFPRDSMVEADDPAPKVKKVSFSQRLKEILKQYDIGNLSERQALDEIRTIFNAEV